MNKYFKTLAISVVLAGLTITGCSEDIASQTSTSDAGKQNYLYTSVVGNSVFLGTFNSLEGSGGALNNKNSYEHVIAAVPEAYGNIVLVSESRDGDKVHKYIRDESGDLSPAGILQLEPSSMATNILFENNTRAFISATGVGKVVVVNPTSMEKLAEIDLSEYAVGTNDNNPEPGDMLIRDGKLYVSLAQGTVMMPPSGHLGAWLAIVDLETYAVDKVITDTRVSTLGYAGHTRAFKDEKNDLYFYGLGFFGYQSGAEEGFIRIKSDETEFDPDYLFSVNKIGVPEQPTGGLQHCMRIAYAGDGIAYAIPAVPALSSNPPNYVTDKNYQPCKFDLRNGTITKLNLPLTAGYSAMGVTLAEEKVLFGLATENGVGIYTYDPKTNTSSQSPVTTTVGNPMYLEYIK